MDGDEHKSLLFAIIIQHLEAEGLELVSNIICDEYASQFGPDQAAELEIAQATITDQIQLPGITGPTALSRLLSAFQQRTAPPPPLTAATPTTTPLPIIAPTIPLHHRNHHPLQSELSVNVGTPVSSKNPAAQSRNRQRRRSSLAISPSDRLMMQGQPLQPRPVPEYRTLPTIENLSLDDKGVVCGGSPLALLRWACRCSWIKYCNDHNHSSNNTAPETGGTPVVQCETDLIAYLITFTDFTTPEDLVKDLKTILSSYPHEAWGLQQFVVRWLEYDFDQLPIRTRRGIIEAIIEIALTCVEVTHQDEHGASVDVTSVSKILLVNALPSTLMDTLQTAESSLCVDDRGGARTPSQSFGDMGGASPSTPSASPRFDERGAMLGSPRSRSSSSTTSSPRSGRKTLRTGGGNGTNAGNANGNGSPRSRSSSSTSNNGSSNGSEMFDYPVHVIAEQLTYVDSAMFRKIPSLEFLNKSWDRNRYENVAEYTWHFTDRWNGMVEYLATLVLHGDGPDDRASRIEYLIDLGNVLWTEYHNFQSASMVNMALEHLSLKTLKQSWERVEMKMVNDSTGTIPPNMPRQTLKERLLKVFWHENNYMNYRMIESRIPKEASIVPSMMVHHKYLFDTHEGAPHLLCPQCKTYNMKDADVCCKSKCRAPLDVNYRSFSRSKNLADLIKKLTRCQRMPYMNILPNREICNMLSKGVQPHIMYFDKHSRSATSKMLIAGKSLGATE